MKTVLTIAGSDSCGGAGIQADIKTITVNGVYAMSAVTALTAQNTLGIKNIYSVPPDFLGQQIDAVFEDIRPNAVKIGMTYSAELISVIADRLTRCNAKNIVIDPVMVSTSGSKLLNNNSISVLEDKLLPLASLITPNIPEAEVLAEMEIKKSDDMVCAAKIIYDRYSSPVLIKGGHSLNNADDLLYNGKCCHFFKGNRIANTNTHGTGCTLSSAIAANLAKGFELDRAVQLAKEYISGAISAMLDLGNGSGPLNHAFDLNSRFADKA